LIFEREDNVVIANEQYVNSPLQSLSTVNRSLGFAASVFGLHGLALTLLSKRAITLLHADKWDAPDFDCSRC
jgi:hypothetical protein